MGGQGLIPAIDYEGAVLVAGVLTLLLTPLVSSIVLGRYRRAVRRSMAARAATAPMGSPLPPPPPGPRPPTAALPVLEWQMEEPDARARQGAASRHPLVREATAAARRAALVHVAAAACYGAVAAQVWLATGGWEVLPRRFTAIAVALTWPLVPTLFSVLVADRRTRWFLVGGYVAVILAIAVPAGAGVGEILILTAIIVVPPAVLLAALSHPRLRAVGPFLAPALFVAGLTFAVWPWLALPLVAAGVSVAVAGLLVWAVGLSAAGLVTLGYLRVIARRYAAKQSTDRGLLISQWWLLATLELMVFLTPSGSALVPMVLLAFVAHEVVVTAGTRLTTRSGTPTGGVRLLLLRTFGSRARSERLLADLGRTWRYLGSVQLIAGVDLATANLEPHEFLEFLHGGLARRFVADQADLDQRLAQRDLAPDPDGRFRVNEFFCHADSWPPAVQALAKDSDAVLMDARGFTARNEGVRYELAALVELVPLDRVVLVADATTEEGALRAVVEQAWLAMPVGSPNWARPVTSLRVLHLGAAGTGASSSALLHALCRAARPVPVKADAQAPVLPAPPPVRPATS